MRKIPQPRSLKMKLCLYFTLIMLVPSLVISWFYFFYSTELLKKTMVDNANTNVTFIINNIDNRLQMIENFSDWVFLNDTFSRTLDDHKLSGALLFKRLIDCQKTLADEIFRSSIASYVASVVITNQRGIDFRIGDNASLIDKKRMESKKWFQDSLVKASEVYIPGIIENPNVMSPEKYVIPVVRPVMDSTYDQRIGWSYLGFKESIFSDVYKDLVGAGDNEIYLMDKSRNCVSASDAKAVGRTLMDNVFLKPLTMDKNAGYYDVLYDGEDNLVIFAKLKSTGWYLVQKVPYTSLNDQKAVLLKVTLTVTLGAVFVMFLFVLFLSSNLTNPLRRILKQVRRISEGDFTKDPTLEGKDEMGELGRGINELAGNVSDLLEKVKQEETEKRNLELMVLQNQVNPHFLYNTLNSIKWMATVQKADGIRNIVSALGRLLMHISKEKSDVIALRQEFSLLDDYIIIQNIRYNGKIKHEYLVDDETLLNHQIVKFTLQPIIENAIFHGIEPKKEAGNIKIWVQQEQDCVLITVLDDGVGMDQESIDKIFSGEDRHQKRGLSGIGIKNVDERLKLTYGERFGLTIESEVGEYTRVLVRIPKTEEAGE